MRIRITFSKFGALQYIGHLDLHRAWERTFRRSGLPLVYSQGFHPQPRLNLACALPLGFTSQCEILDTWLEREFLLTKVKQAISSILPPGLEILNLDTIDLHAPALQTQVVSVVYLISFIDEVPHLEARLNQLMAAEHVLRIRRDKPYDLRPLIEKLNLIPKNEAGKSCLHVQMAAREAATGRPEELLNELCVKFESTHIHREQIILRSD